MTNTLTLWGRSDDLIYADPKGLIESLSEFSDEAAFGHYVGWEISSAEGHPILKVLAEYTGNWEFKVSGYDGCDCCPAPPIVARLSNECEYSVALEIELEDGSMFSLIEKEEDGHEDASSMSNFS